MKFKVGDKVKVVNCEICGEKCKNINRVFTIKKIKEGNPFPYQLGGTFEPFEESELELVNQFTKADLKHGDKCTLKNGQVVFVDKTSRYSFNDIDEQLRYFNDNVSIVKVERPIKYEIVFEREEILDKTEKRYLSEVIRPFKNKVIFISKVRISGYDKEFIFIELKNGDLISLPYFEINTMYKGMKKGKKYTLKELGL